MNVKNPDSVIEFESQNRDFFMQKKITQASQPERSMNQESRIELQGNQ